LVFTANVFVLVVWVCGEFFLVKDPVFQTIAPSLSFLHFLSFFLPFFVFVFIQVIMQLMSSDSFKRFVKSKIYEDLHAELMRVHVILSGDIENSQQIR
jgi:sensor domain CHASE-containing protein